MRKNLKKLTAVTLTAAMTLASTMTAFAVPTAPSGDVANGTGGFEGGAMKYPDISLTVPTVANVDYIADPNDLITNTINSSGDAAKNTYKEYNFSGNTGIYFKTKDKSGDALLGNLEKGLYSQKSEPFTFANESAQDIDLTVTLATTSAASGDIVFSDKGTFEASDKEKKLYLAITDSKNTEAIGASAATIKTELKGQTANFEPNFDGSEYKYVKKATEEVAWSASTYELTGAVNKNAEWEDSITFPNIKITYSYVESPANVAPSIATTSYSLVKDRAIEIPVNLGKGNLKATGLTAANFGTTNFLGKTVTFDAATSKITVNTTAVNAMIGMSGNQTITMVFNDGSTSIPITFTH